MKLELDRTQAMAVAAACQVAASEWAHGPIYSKKWAKILEDICTEIVTCIMSEGRNIP